MYYLHRLGRYRVYVESIYIIDRPTLTLFHSWWTTMPPAKTPNLLQGDLPSGMFVLKPNSNYGLSEIFPWLASIWNDLEKSILDKSYLFHIATRCCIQPAKACNYQSSTNNIFGKKNLSFIQRMIDTGNHFTERTDWNIENCKNKVTHPPLPGWNR